MNVEDLDADVAALCAPLEPDTTAVLNILATGALVADPQRTTAAGNAYAAASMRVPAEDSDAMLVSVIAFAADAVAAILAR
jgi:hypothetical protein